MVNVKVLFIFYSHKKLLPSQADIVKQEKYRKLNNRQQTMDVKIEPTWKEQLKE